MDRRIRIFSLIGLISVIAVVIAGYLWKRQGIERPLDKVGSVSIAASLTLSATPIWLAHDQGLFARAGLETVLHQSETGKTATEAVLKGDVDLAPATEFKAVETFFTRKDLRILGTTSFMHNTRLIALKEKGIGKEADIRGKRVGVNFGTSAEYHLGRLLTLHGMQRGDISWVNMKPQEMIEAIAASKVDAVIVWSPFTLAIEKHFGDRVSSFDGQPGEDFYYVVLTRDDWLKQNPKIAERVMLALKWADEWMEAHPGEAKAYMAKKFNLSPEAIDVEMRSSRFSVGLPQALLTAMEEESRWLVAQGKAGEPINNSLDLIAFEPLEAAAPRAVTMIRGTAAKP